MLSEPERRRPLRSALRALRAKGPGGRAERANDQRSADCGDESRADRCHQPAAQNASQSSITATVSSSAPAPIWLTVSGEIDVGAEVDCTL